MTVISAEGVRLEDVSSNIFSHCVTHLREPPPTSEPTTRKGNRKHISLSTFILSTSMLQVF
jgi:hypothetical protein